MRWRCRQLARRSTTGKGDLQVWKLGCFDRNVGEQTVPFEDFSNLAPVLCGLSVVQLFGTQCKSPPRLLTKSDHFNFAWILGR